MFKLNYPYKKIMHNYALWVINIMDVISFSILILIISYTLSYEGAIFVAFDDPLRLHNFIGSLMPIIIIISPILGYFSDRVGRLIVLKTCLLSCCMAYAILAIFNGYESSIKYFILLILLSSHYNIFTLSLSSICDRYKSNLRYIWIAKLITVYFIFRVVSVLFGYLIRANYLTQHQIIVILPLSASLLMFIGFMITMFFCYEPSTKKWNKNSLLDFKAKLFTSCLRVLHTKYMKVMLFSSILFYITLGFVGEYFMYYLTTGLAISDQHFPIKSILINLIPIIFLLYLYPKLSKLLSQKKILILNLIIFMISTFLSVLFLKSQIWLIIIFIVFIIISVAFILCAYITLLSDLVKPCHIGLVFGMNYALTTLSWSLAWFLSLYGNLYIFLFSALILIIIQIYLLIKIKI